MPGEATYYMPDEATLASRKKQSALNKKLEDRRKEQGRILVMSDNLKSHIAEIEAGDGDFTGVERTMELRALRAELMELLSVDPKESRATKEFIRASSRGLGRKKFTGYKGKK